jgi:hypothetical protein
MTVTTASGPGPADWLAGLVRGFHPLRWLLCLIGLVLTGLSAVVALSLFEQQPPDWPGWWQEPVEHAQALWAEIAGASLGGLILRGGPLLALTAALWCLVGGWIARHELVARQRGRDDAAEVHVGPGATEFLAGWWRSLVLCCPSVLLVALLLLLPVLAAGWVGTWMGGPGALVVSLLLPVLLVGDLFLLVLALGALAWPLMPAALAAECGDQFDALSRGYSYFIQRPVRLLLLTATALGLAGLPLAALYPFAGQMAAWNPGARLAGLLLAAALVASIFWSLQPLVYLHLRAVIDDVDAGEVAVAPAARRTRTPSPGGKAAAAPVPDDRRPAGGQSLVRRTIGQLAGVVGSWCLTFWLLTRATGGGAGWLGWGLGETFVPAAEGLYRAASVVAGLWGVFWLALPFVSAVRRLLRGRASRDEGAVRRPGEGLR